MSETKAWRHPMPAPRTTGAAGVTSVNGRTGAVVGVADLAGATFTGPVSGRGAVSETAAGADRADLGVTAGTPRLILEDATFGLWEIDNNGGTLRFFMPAGVRMSLSTAGDLAVTLGNVDVAQQVRANATAPVLASDLTRKDYVDALVAETVPTAGGFCSPTVSQVFAHNTEDTIVYGSHAESGMVWDAAINEWVMVLDGLYQSVLRNKWAAAFALGNKTAHLYKRSVYGGTGSLIDDDHDAVPATTINLVEQTDLSVRTFNMDAGERLYTTALTLRETSTGSDTLNMNGTRWSVVRLGPKNVNGPLPAPTIGAASAGAASGTVAWTAPAGALSGYTVITYKSSDSSVLAVDPLGVVLTFTKTGLTAGVGVFFKVVARYPRGNGTTQQSAASATVTPT